MTEKELKKLSRADLLQMLIDQSEELEALRERVRLAETAQQEKHIAINEAGSIAEAALQLNGVFEAAQAACQQYTDNIRLLSDRQQSVCDALEKECRETVARQLRETQLRCEKLEAETKVKCDEMVSKAKTESTAYWDEVSEKLERFYADHKGLREMLSAALPLEGTN